MGGASGKEAPDSAKHDDHDQGIMKQLEAATAQDDIPRILFHAKEFNTLIAKDRQACKDAAANERVGPVILQTILSIGSNEEAHITLAHQDCQSQQQQQQKQSSTSTSTAAALVEPTSSTEAQQQQTQQQREDAIHYLLHALRWLMYSPSGVRVVAPEHYQKLFDVVAIALKPTHHHQSADAAIGLALVDKLLTTKLVNPLANSETAHNLLVANGSKLIQLLGRALQNLRMKTTTTTPNPAADQESSADHHHHHSHDFSMIDENDSQLLKNFGLLIQHFFSHWEFKQAVIDDNIAPLFGGAGGGAKELLFGLRNCLEFIAIPVKWNIAHTVVTSTAYARVNAHITIVIHFLRGIYTILSKKAVHSSSQQSDDLLNSEVSIDNNKLNRHALELFAETDAAFLVDFLNVEFDQKTIERVTPDWARHLFALRHAIVKMLQMARAEKLMLALSATDNNDKTDKIIFELNFKVQNQESFHEAIASYPNVVSILEKYSKTRNKDNNKSKEENEEIVKYIENIVAVAKTNYHQN